MVRNIGIAAVAALTLASCAQPQLWNKPGATQSEFAHDKYDCMQQSQQRVSGAYVNGAVGAASNKVITNSGLFGSCMNAHGWYLKAATAALAPNASGAVPPGVHLREAMQEAMHAIEEECKREDLRPYYAKTACKSEDITLDQLADTSHITQDQKEALSKYSTANTAINDKLFRAHLQYGGTKGAKIAESGEKILAEAQGYQLKLYQGEIAWGEYNKARVRLNKQGQENFRAITQAP